MKAFLEEAAEAISQQFDYKSNICLVFPNKRAKIYFNRYYGRLMGKASWAIKGFTIEELVQQLTHIKQVDKLGLLFDLYESFELVKKRNGEKAVSFDQFYSLGEVLLADFNDIDSYLADCENVFTNVSDLQEIDLIFEAFEEEQKTLLQEFWSAFSANNRSKEKERLLQLWQMIPELYADFTKKLLAKKEAYQGLIYKQLWLLCQSKELQLKYDQYLFLGFNALNKAQINFLEYLQKLGKAGFYWDTDQYYQMDKKQEAGLFLQQNMRRFPNAKGFAVPNLLNNPNKKVELINAPLEVGQAKLLPQLLERTEFSADGYSDTVVVLGNEHSLFPVMHSLPPSIDQLNITMGYPFKDTPLYAFLIQYMSMQKAAYHTPKYEFYHKDVLAILKHPLVLDYDEKASADLVKYIVTGSIVYVEPKQLIQGGGELFQLIFEPLGRKGTSLLTSLSNILYELYAFTKKRYQNVTNTIEDEYIFNAYLEIKRLTEVIDKKSDLLSVDMIHKLVKQALTAKTIPFDGETLSGLQVMGVMETRNLDFKNVILLDCNEGCLPKVSTAPSFIPENLRSAFGLPIVKFQDAIFAYVFYRLLQRAENVVMIYNNIVGDSNGGELSRFVQQLQSESLLNITKSEFTEILNTKAFPKIEIAKSDAVKSLIARYVHRDGAPARKRFSASALNAYLDCRLKFYFNYIAELEEVEEVEEKLGPAGFGTIMHKALEEIYQDIKKRKENPIVEREDLKQLTDEKIEAYIDESFKEYYEDRSQKEFEYQGSQLIIREVLIKHIKQVVQCDMDYAPFEIVALEEFRGYEHPMELDLADGQKQTVIVWAVIDRIDRKAGLNRIIDYKTGKIDKEFASIVSLMDRNDEKRNEKVFQVLFYSFVFQKLKKTSNIAPGFYNIRDMYSDNFSPEVVIKVEKEKKKVYGALYDELILEFEKELKGLLEEIFNPEVPFDQTPEVEKCEWCKFKQICSR